MERKRGATQFSTKTHTQKKRRAFQKKSSFVSPSLSRRPLTFLAHTWCLTGLFKNLNNNWSFFSAIVGFLCLHLYYAMQYLYIKDLSISIMLTSLFRLCSTYEIDCDKNFGDMYLICHTNLSENIVFWPVIFFSSDEWFLFYKIARVQK